MVKDAWEAFGRWSEVALHGMVWAQAHKPGRGIDHMDPRKSGQCLTQCTGAPMVVFGAL